MVKKSSFFFAFDVSACPQAETLKGCVALKPFGLRQAERPITNIRLKVADLMETKYCSLCGKQLVEGNPGNKYGTPEGMDYISRHHAFPVRFKNAKYFPTEDLPELFGITDIDLQFDLCYECHEEILHNLVVNESIIESLSMLFRGKSKQEKIGILHNALKEGVKQLTTG